MNTNLEFLTSKQVMEILHISRATLSRMIEKGRVPYTKVGGVNRFPKTYFVQLKEDALHGFEAAS